jgi:hypothetical protein
VQLGVSFDKPGVVASELWFDEVIVDDKPVTCDE